MSDRVEKYKERCEMSRDVANTIASEISYLTSLLEEKEDIEVRKHAFNMLNAYIGMYVSPEGLCSNTLAEVRSDAELSRIVDCKNCEVPKRYFELSKKYRETHKKDK